MRVKDLFNYNDSTYMVVLPFEYESVMYYFVINENNTDDYFFCTLSDDKIIPVSDSKLIDNILLAISSKMEN